MIIHQEACRFRIFSRCRKPGIDTGVQIGRACRRLPAQRLLFLSRNVFHPLPISMTTPRPVPSTNAEIVRDQYNMLPLITALVHGSSVELLVTQKYEWMNLLEQNATVLCSLLIDYIYYSNRIQPSSQSCSYRRSHRCFCNEVATRDAEHCWRICQIICCNRCRFRV